MSADKILSLIKTALKEDIGSGDITTRLTIPAKKRIKAKIIIKEDGIVCGLDAARLTFKCVDKKIHFRPAVSDGEKVKAGKILVNLEGPAPGILKAERVALNFLGRLSGIATKTHRFIQRCLPFKVKIMDTRKTTPGLRILEKYAVRCGGGFNHRMGLWDQVLIKDNHFSVLSYKSTASNLKEIIKKIKKRKPKGVKIEVEVTNLYQFKKALLAGVDIIMLDNMSIKEIEKAVKMRAQMFKARSRMPKLEVSGGINLGNIRRFAATGVDMISVGELTHSVGSLDVSLNCE